MKLLYSIDGMLGAFFHEESHAKHSSSLTLSSSHLFLISFPCHLSFDTVDCIACWRALQIACFTFLASTSLPSATATGLGKFNHNCRSSSSAAYFLASLMMEWRPFFTASSSIWLDATTFAWSDNGLDQMIDSLCNYVFAAASSTCLSSCLVFSKTPWNL